MPTDLNDQYLVYQISALHKREAFDTLYLRYADAIKRFVFIRVQNEEDANDLTADVFWNTWRYLTDKGTKDIQNIRAFLYKVARNAVANFYRVKGKTPPMIELDKPGQHGGVPEVADIRQDIFGAQARAQDEVYLTECVQKLQEPYKEILVLRFFEELGIDEIAEIIEKTPGNTRVLIHRGVRALRSIMDSRSEKYD